MGVCVTATVLVNTGVMEITVVTYFESRKKGGDTKFMAVTLSNLNRFLVIFQSRFSRKFAIKWLLKIPSHVTYVATLRCENIWCRRVHEMSETIWHERFKPSCKIRPFRSSRRRSTVWRCEHYLVTDRNILTTSMLHDPAQTRSGWHFLKHDLYNQTPYFAKMTPWPSSMSDSHFGPEAEAEAGGMRSAQVNVANLLGLFCGSVVTPAKATSKAHIFSSTDFIHLFRTDKSPSYPVDGICSFKQYGFNPLPVNLLSCRWSLFDYLSHY